MHRALILVLGTLLRPTSGTHLGRYDAYALVIRSQGHGRTPQPEPPTCEVDTSLFHGGLKAREPSTCRLHSREPY